MNKIWICYDVYNIDIDPDDGSIELQEYVNAPAFVFWVGEGGRGGGVRRCSWIMCGPLTTPSGCCVGKLLCVCSFSFWRSACAVCT
jgi:hypothetical protein